MTTTSGLTRTLTALVVITSMAQAAQWEMLPPTSEPRAASAIPTAIVEYEYNGQDEVVGVEYLECDVKRERWTGSGLYGALDNFNRVVDDVWVKDLGTDRSIYDVDLVYDRNSNIVRLDDHVHPTKFDAVYTMDGLDRLTDAREGDLNGTSSIVTEARQQTWTLTQTGNWTNEELDLDGDGIFVDADEHDDTRVHNAVNELEERDLDSNPGTTGDNYTLVYDEAGNLIDDGEAYKYEYDCFYRLRKIYDQTDDLVAEYRYNGLGYRIAEHTDTDTDGDVDGSDAWHHFAHDERWRVVAMFINSATDPEEQYVHHAAGADGFGGASYIDEIVLRDRDAVTDINHALDERLYYLQNRHFDVVALVDDAGTQVEMVRYSAYGVPFGLPGGDCDSDGDCDAGDTTDTDQIQTWINASAYDSRGDIDLDGDVDVSDKSAAMSAPFAGATSGHQFLSCLGNAKGMAGREAIRASFISVYAARIRMHSAGLGRWLTRDPALYADTHDLYEFTKSQPTRWLDPSGLFSVDGGCVLPDPDGQPCGASWAKNSERKLWGEWSLTMIIRIDDAGQCGGPDENCSYTIELKIHNTPHGHVGEDDHAQQCMWHPNKCKAGGKKIIEWSGDASQCRLGVSECRFEKHLACNSGTVKQTYNLTTSEPVSRTWDPNGPKAKAKITASLWLSCGFCRDDPPTLQQF